jgi:hypothetical protein
VSDPTGPSDTSTAKVHYPRWLWAVGAVLAVVVAVAVTLLVRTGGKESASEAGGAVDRLIPTANAKILQQEVVGIDLTAGYEAELAVNGVPLPLDQLTVERGLNTVTFQPGPGKDFEQWPAGQSCLTATFWPSASPTQTDLRTWCFTVV